MNNQVKVLLTINEIEGATLHSKGKTKIPFVIRKKDLYAKEYTGKDADKIIRRGVRRVINLEAVPVSKSIKLTIDAYNYMTSSERPEWYFKKDWVLLTPTQRLELHLQRTCEHNGGKSFTYSILED